MIDKSRFDFVLYMTLYGILFGSLVGFLSGMPLILMLFDKPLNLDTIGGGLIGSVIGSIVGIFYGTFGGFFSGIAMLFTTRLFFREIHRPHRYKLVMSVVTVISTPLLLVIFPLWIIFEEAGFAVFWMSLLFAIHASQRVATAYLRVTNVRKRKV